MRSVVIRLSFVLTLALLIPAVVLTWTQVDGERTTDCGRWWDSEVSDAKIEGARADLRELSGSSYALGGLAEMQYDLLAAYEDCADAVESRRTLVLWLAGAGILVLPVTLFVLRGMPRQKA